MAATKKQKTHIQLTLNGEPTEVAFAPHKTLLEVLREDLALTGTKHGCELGECGVCTVLIDGQWYKNGNMDTTMTVIAAGSIRFHANSTWAPAMSNGVMWIAGRDLYTHSNCCAPSNTCATNLGSPSYAAIMAAHEQILTDLQNAQRHGGIAAARGVKIETRLARRLLRLERRCAIGTMPELIRAGSVLD